MDVQVVVVKHKGSKSEPFSSPRADKTKRSQLLDWLIGSVIAYLKYYDIKTNICFWTIKLLRFGLWVRTIFFYPNYLSQNAGYS